MSEAQMTTEQVLKAAADSVQAAEYCFLITVMGDVGWPNARLMQTLALGDDMIVWLGTSVKSRKVREIADNNRVTLACVDTTETAYVTLFGNAAIEAGLAERQQFWREDWVTFFPEGPMGEDFVLIKFVPTRIEVMNFARNVAPEPFGLQPAILVRADVGWQMEQQPGA